MPNKICFTQRSSNQKKRARSQGPVFPGRCVKWDMTKITFMVVVQQCYTMDSHVCNPERAASLMKKCSLRACSRRPKFHLPLRYMGQRWREACTALVSIVQNVVKTQTSLQEEGRMKSVFRAGNLPNPKSDHHWEVLWPLLQEKIYAYNEVKPLSRVQLFVTPWTVAYQAPLSMGWILQARILEWVALSFSRVSSQPGDWTQVSHSAGRPFNLWATREYSSQY